MAGPWEKYQAQPQQKVPPWVKYAKQQPVAPVDEAPPNPAEDFQATLQFATPFGTFDTGVELPSAASLALAGAGKSFADTAQGFGQLLGDVSQEEVDERRKLDAPLMATGWGAAGNIGGQIGQMYLPAGGVARAVGLAGRVAPAVARVVPHLSAAAEGAAFAGVQPVGSGETRLGNAAVGGAFGAAGQGVASGLGALANRANSALAPVKESITAARKHGIPLHLSQTTDSRALKGLSAVTSNLPLTGAGRAAARQQQAFNRAVGRSFGVKDAPHLTDDVMKAARARIGSVYDDVFARNDVALGDGDLRLLVAIERDAIRNMTTEQSAVVSRQVQKIIDDFADGSVSGDKYQSLRGSLADAADAGQAGKAIKALRKVLDEAAYRSVGGSDAQALRRANSMWANMRTAEDALKQVEGAKGNVRPASLWPLIRNGSTPEMRELAKIGQNVLKNEIPNSGTPERELWMRTLGVGGGGALGGLSAPLILKAAATGAGVGRLLNSPAAARVLGEARPINGLARLAKPANKVLPAAANATGLAGLVLDISGGTEGAPVSQSQLEQLWAQSGY